MRSYLTHASRGGDRPRRLESAVELASKLDKPERCRWDRNNSGSTRECIEGARQPRDSRLTETRAEFAAKRVAEPYRVPLAKSLRHSDHLVNIEFGVADSDPLPFSATTASHFPNPNVGAGHATLPSAHHGKTYASGWHEHCGKALDLSTTTNAEGLAAASAPRGTPPSRYGRGRNTSAVPLAVRDANPDVPTTATRRAHGTRHPRELYREHQFGSKTRANMKHIGNATSAPMGEVFEHKLTGDPPADSPNIKRTAKAEAPAAKGGGVDVHYPSDEVMGAWNIGDRAKAPAQRSRPGVKLGSTHPAPGFGGSTKDVVSATEYAGEFKKNRVPVFVPPDPYRRTSSRVRLVDETNDMPDFAPSQYKTAHAKSSEPLVVPERLAFQATKSSFKIMDLGENAPENERYSTSYGGGGAPMFSETHARQHRHAGPPPFDPNGTTVSALSTATLDATAFAAAAKARRAEQASMFADVMSPGRAGVGYPSRRGKHADAARVLKDEADAGVPGVDAARFGFHRERAGNVRPAALGDIGSYEL